jgi:UDP-N-acetylglucosamine acyltransferase
MLEIGDRNTIREFVTINRGTEEGGGITRIGSDNWLMAYIHIAHDCILGDNIIMANAASLAGHVRVDDYAILGGFTLVHQFCAIGSHSFCGMGSAVSKDVPPYVMVNGNPAHPHGLNIEGLRRMKLDRDTMQALREAYKIVYRGGHTTKEAVMHLASLSQSFPEVEKMKTFIQDSQRGILR